MPWPGGNGTLVASGTHDGAIPGTSGRADGRARPALHIFVEPVAS